mmetsp:Transcript_55900/g.170167  ORF Transcript_55900/g.170167 Transcript_55900/m.170167 type:complete len:139 (+) Transcript_55900:1008-1424(+)
MLENKSLDRRVLRHHQRSLPHLHAPIAKSVRCALLSELSGCWRVRSYVRFLHSDDYNYKHDNALFNIHDKLGDFYYVHEHFDHVFKHFHDHDDIIVNDNIDDDDIDMLSLTRLHRSLCRFELAMRNIVLPLMCQTRLL